ncbi:MAG: branched-chain amino acid ABC transporter permease [Burkholderiaceae bacterium]|nr:branched-chain amino acid ABC transporter permease [Burkholderiaceae bacterium]
MGTWRPRVSSAAAGAQMRFAPVNFGRWLTWGLTIALFAVMPLIFTSGFALTLLSQMGVMIILTLSYNVIFGQGGMLSFGHAVYAGLGGFFAIHAINLVSHQALPLPISLIPLVGGVFGALFGVIFGYVTTKRAGTTFAMISLGIGEMVFAAALMFPGFFGGEGGITANRVVGKPFLGISYGPSIQVYYLIVFWCVISMVGMYAFSSTPLGRISNAVRDNPERAEFIGYNTQRVRFLVLVVSAFFAGIAGGLSAIMFEIVSAENVSAVRSGGMLLATFIGGASFFFGPILGAIIFIFFAVALSDFTSAWLFYLGAFFVIIVMYSPGGVAALVLMNLRVFKYGLFGRLRDPYLGVLLTGAVLLLGVVMVVEMSYHLSLNVAAGSTMKFMGFTIDTWSRDSWTLAIGMLVAGAVAFEVMRRRFVLEWSAVQELIEAAAEREVMV